MMIAVKTFTGIIAVHFILASSVFACGGGGHDCTPWPKCRWDDSK